MPELTAPAAACLLAFLVGSIPFGLLFARLAQGRDLRALGSGNVGATNVTRVLGFWPWGLLTFLLDFTKGVVPVLLLSSGWARATASELLGGGMSWEVSRPEIWAAALSCVLGHCYSPWLRFKGGKGVSTGLGVVSVLSPLAAAAGVVAFGLAFAATRTGSRSSLCGLLAGAVAYLVFEPVGSYLWFGALILGVVLVRHDGNLDALLENRESTFA